MCETKHSLQSCLGRWENGIMSCVMWSFFFSSSGTYCFHGNLHTAARSTQTQQTPISRPVCLTDPPPISIYPSVAADASSFLFVQSFCLLAEWTATRGAWIHRHTRYITRSIPLGSSLTYLQIKPCHSIHAFPHRVNPSFTGAIQK